MCDLVVLDVGVVPVVTLTSNLFDHLALHVEGPDLVILVLGGRSDLVTFARGESGERVDAFKTQLSHYLDVHCFERVLVTHNYNFLIQINKISNVTINSVFIGKSIRIKVDGDEVDAVDDALGEPVLVQSTVGWQG